MVGVFEEFIDFVEFLFRFAVVSIFLVVRFFGLFRGVFFIVFYVVIVYVIREVRDKGG